jgi:serine/threonine protein kinase
MSHRPLSSGILLANRYRIEHLIKSGGFAAVYVAIDLRQRKRCAVKETFDPSPDGADQFRLEADILSGVRHANLPAVWDYFQDNGGLYLVMEYIEGEDLESRLEEESTFSEEEVRKWALQICDAISALHLHHPPIIHRDIKPANIKITPSGQAVLVDFGIAKLFHQGSNTQVAARAVTDGFSPIEQYGQGSTDARSDIYALGATIYNLLTGIIPPDAPSRYSEDTLIAPTRINHRISPLMEQIILKALRVRAGERFFTAEEMQHALIESGRQFSSRQNISGPLPTPIPPSPTGNLGVWFCTSCHARNSTAVSFCQHCGALAALDDVDMPTRIIRQTGSLSSVPPPIHQSQPKTPGIVHSGIDQAWEIMAGPPGGVLLSIASHPNHGLVACGERGLVLVHNNDTWMPLPQATTYSLHAIAGYGGHIWAVGEYGTVAHLISGRWSILQGELPENLQAIALDSSMSGWIASSSGALVDLRDLALSPLPVRRGQVRAISIDDLGDGWAVGEHSLLLRLVQGTWKSRSNSMSWGGLYGVAHNEPGEAWAVGQKGIFLKVNDVGWQEGPTLRLPDLHGIAFNHRGEGWAIGDNGAIVYYDGNRWSIPGPPCPVALHLRSVAWLNDDEAWAIGERGTVLRWRR